MRIPLLRTLSGRIVLGFTVLTLTFGTVSALIVFNMELLSREIRLIRTSYLPLALETKNLDEKQDVLWSYLSNELASESEPKRAERQLIRHRQARFKSLRATEKVLGELSAVPPHHERQIDRTRVLVAEIRDLIATQTPRYKILLQSPPLDNRNDRTDLPDIEQKQYEKTKATLDELRAAESEIRARVQFLARQQSDQARYTTLTLERNERRLRLFAIYLGLTAVFIGLLITIWATMTLRPLQRLRDAARRIAQGQYASRIDEAGPAEVADLAREFNVMGHAIEERERELVRQERLVAVGKMAAMITHEIRNPLSALGLNTELLEEELGELPDPTEAQNLCRAITTEVDRLTAITEEYLQFARLPKPKRRLEQINTIARDLAEFQREQMALRNVELTVDLADDLPPARVDDAQLRQALLNLLRNAAEAVAEGGGHVTLATRLARSEAGDHVEILVGDTGPGIAEETAPKLFDAFFSTKEGGTGLGLALTRQIIREHGGDIRVESQPGQGATFIISLPAA
jgi:two-component system, NtrC family, sensor kinase